MSTTGWVKSSYSTANGACVEWHRASHCNGGTCTEVAVRPDGVLVRDSQMGERSPVLSFSAEAWAAFIGCVKAAR